MSMNAPHPLVFSLVWFWYIVHVAGAGVGMQRKTTMMIQNGIQQQENLLWFRYNKTGKRGLRQKRRLLEIGLDI